MQQQFYSSLSLPHFRPAEFLLIKHIKLYKILSHDQLITALNEKAQLTQGLRAKAPSFQDGGCSQMAVSRHLGLILSNRKWHHSIRRPRKPLPRTRHGVDRMHLLRDIYL